MSARNLAAVVVALSLVGGCGSGSGQVSGDFRTVSDVTVRLRIEPARTRLGRAVRVSLVLTNNSGRPKRLAFSAEEGFDLWAVQDGREVWRWSEGDAAEARDPTMELEGQGSEHLAATWTPPRAGRYTVHGEVLARGFEGELSAGLIVEES